MNLFPFVQRVQNVRAYLEHSQGNFYLVTNLDAPDFKVMKRTFNTEWSDYIPEAQGRKIEEIDIFQNYLVLYCKEEGLPSVLVHSLKDAAQYKMPLEHDICSIKPCANLEFNQKIFRYKFSSPLVLSNEMIHNMETKEQNSLQKKKLEGHPIYPENFEVKQITVPGEFEQPVTLFYHKKNKTQKLLLKGYGAYGMCPEFDFKYSELIAAENGWVIAQSHVRGGGEKGEAWHQSGMKENKVNSINDFINTAQFLIAQRITKPNLFAAYGASAGGLLVGQTINQMPNLFKAAVLDVPFLDLISLMSDESLPLTIPEYEEWGNPASDYIKMSNISPYENIQTNHQYPAMYITAGIKDMRVPFWSVLKYVKRLRDRKAVQNYKLCEQDIALNIMDAGHLTHQQDHEALMWGFLNSIISI